MKVFRVNSPVGDAVNPVSDFIVHIRDLRMIDTVDSRQNQNGLFKLFMGLLVLALRLVDLADQIECVCDFLALVPVCTTIALE